MLHRETNRNQTKVKLHQLMEPKMNTIFGSRNGNQAFIQDFFIERENDRVAIRPQRARGCGRGHHGVQKKILLVFGGFIHFHKCQCCYFSYQFLMMIYDFLWGEEIFSWVGKSQVPHSPL